MGVGAPPRRGQGEQVAAAARRGRVKTRLDWRKLLAYETRVVGTVAAPPSRIVPDPSSFAIPRAHGVEYDKDGTKLRAKKYDAEKTARIEDARTYGKNQEEINVTVLPYIAKIVRRVERIERATADSDTPVALRSSLSRIELGEDTESKGPNK